MYIRFVLARHDSTSGRRSGFFDAAYELHDNNDTPAYTARHLSALLVWFTKNLTTPSRLNRTSSKGAYRRNTLGLSWFKPTASIHIAKAHELCAILRDSGYAITILKTKRPGFVVYEDEHQIVAEPFADTPT